MASPRPTPLDRNHLPEHLTTSEVSRLTGLHRQTIWRHCKAGTLLADQLGPRGAWRVPTAVLRQRMHSLLAAAPSANDVDPDNDCDSDVDLAR